MVGALQRPRHGQHGAPGRHAARQRADDVGRDGGDPGRPFGILGHAVALAHEVAPEPVEAGRVALQEVLVVAALGDQRVGDAEHQRGVGVGSGRDPLGFEGGVGVGAVGADIDEVDAVLAAAPEPAAHVVAADAAVVDLGVLERDAAEHHHQVAVPGDHRPGGVAAAEAADRADDVRQDHLRGGHRVGVDRVAVAADRVHEAVHVALRMVEAPGAAPAVGAGVDRRVAEFAAHAVELGGGEVEGARPRDGHERLPAAAALGSAGSVLEPALADHRPGDAVGCG